MSAARTAIVVGASSGIGEAIARQLAAAGWRVGLAARRTEAIERIAAEIGNGAQAETVDLTDSDAARQGLERLADRLGDVELWVLNAGTGTPNPDLDWSIERDTILTNVLGFAAMCEVAMHHCLDRKRGRIVGVSSIARFRGGSGGGSYAASKAFASVYLDALRDYARHSGSDITVTEACPGFVRTPMMKAPNAFWVASADKAARQIIDGTLRGRRLIYVTRRWRLIAWLLRLLPR